MSDGRPGGSRRWTLLLVLLALVVFGGIALRASGIDLRDRADREAPGQRATDDDDGSVAAPAVDEPIEGDLVIEVARVTGSDGQPADAVRTLGPVRLDSLATLPYAASTLGTPDSSGPADGEPSLCAASWGAYELQAWFTSAQPSAEGPCSSGTVAVAIARGSQWRVEPLGIAIGDDLATLEQSLPGSTAQELPPAFAQLVEAQEAYVLATDGPTGRRSPALYATTEGGRVEGFVLVADPG